MFLSIDCRPFSRLASYFVHSARLKVSSGDSSGSEYPPAAMCSINRDYGDLNGTVDSVTGMKFTLYSLLFW